jgi:hypothetical protein
MTRVSARYKAKNREKAVSSLAGAMYLVRAGELTSEMLGPNGYDALKSASEDFAKKGDDGRARAVYEMLNRIAKPAEKADIKGHLDAINAWTKDTGGGGVMQQAGALESAAVTRHLLEPSTEARDEASARTVDFVEKALAVRNARKKGSPITRDEGLEAVRALETGTTVLAAIHLRNADAQGALGALDKANIRELGRVELIRALEAVIERPEPEKWLDLARLLRPAPQTSEPVHVVRINAEFLARIQRALGANGVEVRVHGEGLPLSVLPIYADGPGVPDGSLGVLMPIGGDS